MGQFEDPEISGQIGHLEFRQSALPGAQKLARAADSQILFGNPESVRGFFHNLQPLLGLRRGKIPEEQAI